MATGPLTMRAAAVAAMAMMMAPRAARVVGRGKVSAEAVAVELVFHAHRYRSRYI